MKLLVLGANGQVGRELVRALAPLGETIAATRSGSDAHGAACERIDIADAVSTRAALARIAPDVIANAAAYTAVDRAEDEPGLADAANHRAPATLGAFAAEHGIPIVHYSTDYVFDGTSARPYREDDATAPLGAYGRSKLAGEAALRASGAAHLVFRTAWVYSAHGHNFLRTMLRLARERDVLRVVDDQIGAPTPARWIADATADALRRWLAGARVDDALSGTYNLVAAGRCSWFEFAQAIVAGAREVGLIDRDVRVEPIATADFPTRARRPAFSVLDGGKLAQRFGINSPPWKDGLRAVLAELSAERAAQGDR